MAKKKASRAAAGAPVSSEADLCYTAVVTSAAEGLLGTVDYLDIDINAVVNVFPATVQDVSATRRSDWTGLNWMQRALVRRDFADLPYLRFIGRVLDVLLNHRRFESCTTGDVLKVFLVEIPDQLEVNHRQNLEDGRDVDVTRQPARRTFNNRMARMCREELARPTVTRESGREEGYVLTEDGQKMFDNWPPLNEIPGLQYDGPVMPENSARRRPKRRSRRRS